MFRINRRFFVAFIIVNFSDKVKSGREENSFFVNEESGGSGWRVADRSHESQRIGGACGAGFEFYMMGALRCDSRDARTCIENRFTLFALFCRLQIGRAEHGVFLARSSHVKLKHAQNKFCGLAAVIQARIRRCRVFGIPDPYGSDRAGIPGQGAESEEKGESRNGNH